MRKTLTVESAHHLLKTIHVLIMEGKILLTVTVLLGTERSVLHAVLSAK